MESNGRQEAANPPVIPYAGRLGEMSKRESVERCVWLIEAMSSFIPGVLKYFVLFLNK